MRGTAIILAAGAAVVVAGPAHALSFDQDVTNNVIYGSGNANGGWTVDRDNGIELGLRAHVRYDVADDQPKNIFNSNGDGTYYHAAGAPVSNPDRARWNFDWSINSDFDGTGSVLDSLIYEIALDYDPTAGTNFFTFDPINVPYVDHSIGDNTTAESAGQTAANPSEYASLIATNNLAQNSWTLAFFDSASFPFDPNLDGTYDFILTALDGQGTTTLAQTRIQVIVGNGAASVPEPGSIVLLLGGLAGLAFARRRRRGNAITHGVAE